MSESRKKTIVPPIIIQHNEAGRVVLGNEKKDVLRPADVRLNASHGDCTLRLFTDGGFQLQGSKSKGAKTGGEENKKAGSSISCTCPNSPLMIDAEGNITINAGKILRLQADKIIMESYTAEGVGINVNAAADIRFETKKDFMVVGGNITHDAKDKMLIVSRGWNVISCQTIRITESVSKLNPIAWKAYIKKLLINL